VGSNPPQNMDVCLRISVLCCPEEAEVVHRADPPSRESYQTWNLIIISGVIMNWNRSQGLICIAADDKVKLSTLSAFSYTNEEVSSA
jgi:hypothetical protein